MRVIKITPIFFLGVTFFLNACFGPEPQKPKPEVSEEEKKNQIWDDLYLIPFFELSKDIFLTWDVRKEWTMFGQSPSLTLGRRFLLMFFAGTNEEEKQ